MFNGFFVVCLGILIVLGASCNCLNLVHDDDILSSVNIAYQWRLKVLTIYMWLWRKVPDVLIKLYKYTDGPTVHMISNPA